MKKIKCYFCSKMVEVTRKNRLAQHHNLPQHKRCTGSGQPSTHVFAHNKTLESVRLERLQKLKK